MEILLTPEWKCYDAKTGYRLGCTVWANDETHKVGMCQCALAFGIPEPLPWCQRDKAVEFHVPKVIIDERRRVVLVNINDENLDNALWDTTPLERIDPA